MKKSLESVIEMYVEDIGILEDKYLIDILNDLISSKEELIEFVLYYNNLVKIYPKRYITYPHSGFQLFCTNIIKYLKLYNQSVLDKLKLVQLLD